MLKKVLSGKSLNKRHYYGLLISNDISIHRKYLSTRRRGVKNAPPPMKQPEEAWVSVKDSSGGIVFISYFLKCFSIGGMKLLMRLLLSVILNQKLLI